MAGVRERLAALVGRRFYRNLARDIVWPFLPEATRTRIGRHFCGYRPNPARFRLEFSGEDESLSATIDGTLALRIPASARKRMEFQFVNNGDCVDESRVFLAESARAKLLFDVGASDGVFSAVFCLLGKDKKAVAFEPSSALRAAAGQLVKLNGLEERVQILGTALGNRVGTETLFLEPSGYFHAARLEDTAVPRTVETTTLDAECRRSGLTPDLLKIDVDGYELEVLEGGSELLARRKPVICLEFHLNYLESRGIAPRRVTRLLERFGYRFFSNTGRPLVARQIYDSMQSVCRFVAK